MLTLWESDALRVFVVISSVCSIFYSSLDDVFMQVAEQDYEKEKLNERIAKLSGGVAVIQVFSNPCINVDC
jgi:chaperonin GroEL (HSP60 family)